MHEDMFDFGTALTHLKAGRKVARQGWNGKGMWIMLIQVNDWTCPVEIPDGTKIALCLAMKTAQGGIQPGWLASQADMLAEDWVLV